jgi:hypothetical protein
MLHVIPPNDIIDAATQYRIRRHTIIAQSI